MSGSLPPQKITFCYALAVLWKIDFNFPQLCTSMIQIMAVVTGCVINVNSNGIYWNNETISCSYLIFAWLQTENNFNQKDIKKNS